MGSQAPPLTPALGNEFEKAAVSWGLTDGFDVATLAQTSYHPLFARPLDWLKAAPASPAPPSPSKWLPFGEGTAEEKKGSPGDGVCGEGTKAVPEAETEEAEATRLAGLLNELQFFEPPREMNASTLLAEAEDWHGVLSGGQRAKADFVRVVLARNHCPALLLVDEGFAALDPMAKALVHRKLRAACARSLVLVIYHTDVVAAVLSSTLRATASPTEDSCFTSGSNFFDENLHFSGGVAKLRPLCE